VHFPGEGKPRGLEQILALYSTHGRANFSQEGFESCRIAVSTAANIVVLDYRISAAPSEPKK